MSELFYTSNEFRIRFFEGGLENLCDHLERTNNGIYMIITSGTANLLANENYYLLKEKTEVSFSHGGVFQFIECSYDFSAKV